MPPYARLSGCRSRRAGGRSLPVRRRLDARWEQSAGSSACRGWCEYANHPRSPHWGPGVMRPRLPIAALTGAVCGVYADGHRRHSLSTRCRQPRRSRRPHRWSLPRRQPLRRYRPNSGPRGAPRRGSPKSWRGTPPGRHDGKRFARAPEQRLRAVESSSTVLFRGNRPARESVDALRRNRGHHGRWMWGYATTRGCNQKPITPSVNDPHPPRHPEGTRSLCAGSTVRSCPRGWPREPLSQRTGRGVGVRVVRQATGFVMLPPHGAAAFVSPPLGCPCGLAASRSGRRPEPNPTGSPRSRRPRSARRRLRA